MLADVAADLPEVVGAGYETRLRDVLEAHREQFDLILLDAPPGLGTLPGLAVLAADGPLVPALPQTSIFAAPARSMTWSRASFRIFGSWDRFRMGCLAVLRKG